ncbi:MAG: hypothetical protein WA003_15725 [Desulfuromonadaceae bacterium]
MTAKKMAPRDQYCECGCGLKFAGQAVLNARWIRGHEDKMCELIKAGKAKPPFVITCQFCELEDVPALGRGQKYCTERLTGRKCQQQAKDANRYAKAGLPKKHTPSKPSPKYKYPFDRVKECLKDTEGRWCECVDNARCLEAVSEGGLPKLQSGMEKHCYRPTRAASAGSAIDCTVYHSENKRSQSSRGAQ